MTAQADVGYHAIQHGRWHWGEAAFWIVALGLRVRLPSRYLIMTDIVRLALFALSLDLILAMPASSRWDMRHSSASAPMLQACWHYTALSASRWSRCWRPGLPPWRSAS